MKTITIRDFRSKPARVRREIKAAGEAVLTVNGKPFALLTPVDDKDVDDVAKAIRRARAQLAVARLQEESVRRGLDRVSLAEINREISRARRRRGSPRG
jgi:antitoxin (DNA-binding transcriptional repressor) of toxin-antitoxin stability system